MGRLRTNLAGNHALHVKSTVYVVQRSRFICKPFNGLKLWLKIGRVRSNSAGNHGLHVKFTVYAVQRSRLIL